MKPARILLADDHQLTVAGVRGILESLYHVVGEEHDGRSLVRAACSLRPDLIVLGITMRQLNGIEAAAQIRRRLPEVKLLFLTMHGSARYLEAALNVGANGYVLKTATGKELLKAVDSVLNGSIYVSPGISGEHLGRFGSSVRAAAPVSLSPRERDVLRLIAEGRASKEIGFLLTISPRTVEFHRDNIKNKLGVRSTAGLTRYTISQDLI
jgi:DNA-binding NarL/FixJ family response regulator